MRRFYLFPRGKIYYCQLKNPQTGKLLSAKSTGKTDYGAAELIAMSWLVNGIPQSRTLVPRTSDKTFTFAAFEKLKGVELSPEDTKRIIDLLRRRELIQGAPIKKDRPNRIEWLLPFWCLRTT